MGKLVHFRADGSAVEVRLDRQRITIGRRADNDFCLPYPAVSGEHAAVVTILADSFLEDLGSTNGTLVNGTAVAKHFLRDRDEIDVGKQILIYVVDDIAKLDPPRRKQEPVDEDANAEIPNRTVAGAGLQGMPQADFIMPPPVDATLSASLAANGAHGDDANTDERTAPIQTSASIAATFAVRLADAAPAPQPRQRMDAEPALRVVSGPKAGRIVALVKDETLIGRAGVQVIALRRAPDELWVVPIEGTSRPLVNGAEVVPEGQTLAVGDVLEIAGTRLEVIAAAKRPSG